MRKSKPTTAAERAEWHRQWTYAGADLGVPVRLLDDVDYLVTTLAAREASDKQVDDEVERLFCDRDCTCGAGANREWAKRMVAQKVRAELALAAREGEVERLDHEVDALRAKHDGLLYQYRACHDEKAALESQLRTVQEELAEEQRRGARAYGKVYIALAAAQAREGRLRKALELIQGHSPLGKGRCAWCGLERCQPHCDVGDALSTPGAPREGLCACGHAIEAHYASDGACYYCSCTQPREGEKS